MLKETKDRINKRKIAFIYLMHRMFEGSPALMLKILQVPGISVEDLQDWDLDYKDAVYQTIQEEDSKGVVLKDPEPVPSIKSIKDKILRRLNDIAKEAVDPSKLANAYKVLSEYEGNDEQKEESIIDAINKSVKPLTKKQKEKTMLERMREEGKVVDTGKRRPGRPPKKAVQKEEKEVSQEVNAPEE